MLSFFYSLYLALFSGTWTLYQAGEVTNISKYVWGDLTNFVGNALGGHFDTLQSFNWTYSPAQMTALFLAFFTLVSICAGVFALVKGVFRIFFNRG